MGFQREDGAVWHLPRVHASFMAPLALAAIVARADWPSDPVALWQKSLAAQRLPDSKADVQLVTTTSAGDEVRLQIRIVARLADDNVSRMVLARVVSGGTLRGTALLVKEHQDAPLDLWMYLPAIAAPRRLLASNLGDSFVGSEVRFGDLLQLNPDNYRATLQGERVIDGEPCWGLEIVPRERQLERDTGLSRQVLWLRKSNLMERQVEQYDRQGELLKVIDVPRWLDVGGGKFWYPLERVIQNRQTGVSSKVLFSNVETGTGVSADLFGPQHLAGGSG